MLILMFPPSLTIVAALLHDRMPAVRARLGSLQAAKHLAPWKREVIDWKPERHQKDYEQYAHPDFDPGVTEWDGRLFDGWKPHPA